MRDVRPARRVGDERPQWWEPFEKYLTLKIGLAAAVVVVVFGVGLVSIVRGLGSAAAPAIKVVKGQDAKVKGLAVGAGSAKFTILTPTHADWDFDDKSLIYDEIKEVVKYQLTLRDADMKVVISQQKMPEELKPTTGAKFNQFILSSNVVRSEPVREGKVYYQAALTNGAQANGTTTVIYATDDVLMFGNAPAVMAYDKWAVLMSSMSKTSK
jgi:hypothetical protein